MELATLQWVYWFNHRRLLEPIGHIPPAEAEANYWKQQAIVTGLEVSTQTNQPPRIPERFSIDDPHWELFWRAIH